MSSPFTRLFTARALAVLLLLGVAAPSIGWAKRKAPASAAPARVYGNKRFGRNDTTYQYVAGVFDKLQAYWEKQAYEQRLTANALLSFALDDEGRLIASKLDTPAGSQSGLTPVGPEASSEKDAAGTDALAFLKQSAPFGRLPETLAGSRLEFTFKLAPGSMQMISYKVVESPRTDAVLSYAAPVTPTPPAASLFYARVVDTVEAPKVGKVWDKPDSRTSDEEAMDQYIEGVRERIRQQWKQPENAVSFAPVTALLQIDRDGSLLSATLTQSSGSKAIDKAILNTIYEAAPFKDAPDDIKSLPVTLEYVFEPVVSTVFE
jgi:TonB family protein